MTKAKSALASSVREQLHEHVRDGVRHQDADRVAADPDEGGVAEGDERAVSRG